VSQLAPYTGAFSARASQITRNIDRYEATWHTEHPGVEPAWELAFRTVFHFHLHVIPRYARDGWTLKAESPERKRWLLDSDAQAIKDALASTG